MTTSADRTVPFVSRRRVLQAAAAIVPLHVASRVSAAVARYQKASAAHQPDEDLLALGARDAVARIRDGELNAEDRPHSSPLVQPAHGGRRD